MRTSFFRMTGAACLLLGTFLSLNATRNDDPMFLIMRLIGAQDPESVTEEDFEHYSSCLDRPLRINFLSSSAISSSGIMTPYQAASLTDYRERHGDVLSMSELALVDGFSMETVERIAPFISLESSAIPGRASDRKPYISNDLAARGGWKHAEDGTYSYGLKYRLMAGDTYNAGISLSKAYGDKVHWPYARSFYFSYSGRRLTKLVVGDYNLRYGQGLALWTGFSMSGAGSPASLYRKVSGITPYWSWSGAGSRRGAAAEVQFGRVAVSVSVAVDGLREKINGVKDVPLAVDPGLNVRWTGRKAMVSFTYSDLKAAADFAWCIRGVDVFGEAAFDIRNLAPAAVAGVQFRCGDPLVMAVSGRYYPAAYKPAYAGAVRSGSKCSNEHGVSVAGEFAAGQRVALKGQEGFGSTVLRHRGTFSVDAVHFPEKKAGTPAGAIQVKMQVEYRCQISPSVSLAVRLSERLRDYSVRHRTDVRADIRYGNGDWSAVCRLNALYGKDLSLLSYVEGGYKSGKVSMYMKTGVFKADNWEDRIYAYERDVPGSFNVPAFYGRGWWASCSAGVALSKWCCAYLRASVTRYPWQAPEKEKPGRAELKFQIMMTL